MSQSDSFINEVTEQVRRERLTLWLRRWGWVVGLAILLVVAAAAAWEWQRSQARAEAELRGDALLSALETPEAAARVAALDELPRTGPEGVVAALLLAAEQESEGDVASAIATLDAAAAEDATPAVYRDLAALKAQMLRGGEADPAALDALAAPGRPFRLLALETRATADLAAGRRDEAVAGLRLVAEDAATGPAQENRVAALLTALGAPPEPAEAASAGN